MGNIAKQQGKESMSPYSQKIPPMKNWDNIVEKIKAILEVSPYSKEQQHAFVEILPVSVYGAVTRTNKVIQYGTTVADLQGVLRSKQRELDEFDRQGSPATLDVTEIRKTSGQNHPQILSTGKRGELALEIEEIEKAINACGSGKPPDYLRAGIILCICELYLHVFQEPPTATRDGVFVKLLDALLGYGYAPDPSRELQVLFSRGAVERSRMDMFSLIQAVADLRVRTKNSQ
jgi:hypothetical protein